MPNIIEERIQRWQDKLIDLSKRNRLLHFRPTKVTTIKIVDEQPAEILRILAIEQEGMEFLHSKEEDLFHKEDAKQDSSVEFELYEKVDVEERHKDKYLQTNLVKDQLSKNLFRIYSKANSIMKEQGYNVLFLALGCLEWYESESSDIKLKAPIILVPVELTRSSVRSKFKLKFHEEDQYIINPALILKMQRDFGIILNPIDEEKEKINPIEIFDEIKSAIRSNERWRVTNDTYLGLFSFAKFIMYKDVEKFRDVLINNPIIKIICGQSNEQRVSLGLIPEDKDLDIKIKPLKTFQILDADSSQQKAILAVKNGKNLVIEGPPGTGKSQTIANIIAEFLSENKKVLFMSQKMAALEVVKKRLDNNGLGDFCLELHSRKANKKEISKELVRVLEMQKKQDHSHDEEMVKLEKIREDLNKYVMEIHTPYGNLEMTPFQAMGIINSHPEIQDIAFMFMNAVALDRNTFNGYYELLDNLAHNLSIIGNPNQHPWYGAQLTDFHYQDKLRLAELLNSIIDNHLNIQSNVLKLAKYTCFNEPSSISEIEIMIEASKLLVDAPKVIKAKLENAHWNSLSADIIDIINTVRFFNEFKNEIALTYRIEDIFVENIDINAFLKRYSSYVKNPFLLLTSSFWRDRNTIRKYIVNKKFKPSLKNITDDLRKMIQGKQLAEKITNLDNVGKELFDVLWRGKESKWEELDAFSKWMVKFRYYVIKKYFHNSIFDELSEKRKEAEDTKRVSSVLSDMLNKIKDDIKSLIDLTKIDESLTFKMSFAEFPLLSLIKKISDINNSIDKLDEWIKYQNSLFECKKAGFSDFLNKIEYLNLAYEKIADVFKCQFLRCWLDTAFSERAALRKFRGEDHEKLIEKFCELDKKQIELAKIRLQHNLSGKFDTIYIPNPSRGSELGILLRESKKMRAHMSIRSLFEEIPRIITALKPCLLMSPLTVSQFLNPELVNFDLVIFDEASQIPTEDALGSILRAKQIVIAGDNKQLPPTTFFQSEVITSEDIEDSKVEELPDDLDSILDECASSNIPRTMLRWHYRSKHESLITFSNKNFYDSYLFTFPCAEEEVPSLGIKFYYKPNTSYDRGRTGANIEEAREVAKAALQHFREYPDLTLGVGTFSIRQKYAIEDMIDQMLREDNSLEPFFNEDKLESFFVKNLETIQGDERDVIFISVGYGKDANGKLYMNFGPINQLGGPRRLNVLITRARRRVEIFSSIRGDDFDLSRTDSVGVRLLKNYLDFAEKGKTVLIKGVDSEGFLESPFEESVYNLLVAKGIKVKKQVGCSGYRIDLAVQDENNPGKYILGIECDGAHYHSSATARDRDRLRGQILEDLNWNLYRIWSTDWFKNPRNEFEKLLVAINQAKKGEFKKKLKISPDYIIQLKKNPPRELFNQSNNNIVNVYKKTPILHKYKLEDFYRFWQVDKIATVLKKVVDYESPIQKEEAMRRVIQHWDIASLGSRVRGILESVENYCTSKKMIKKIGKFYWKIDMTQPNVRIRESEDIKQIDLIAPEEIGEAAIIVLSKEYSMPFESLVYQTAKLLGFGRLPDETYFYIQKAINSYIKEGKIAKKEDKLILP
ncbi:MAG: DUF3320 domain-containing protein [Candidatus Omnitrophica bacterium]|nr:DUF3320 domain-containing protein [Candidatus Omnitrophota bacterium]